MIYLCKKFKGLEIVFKPGKFYKNEYDQINKSPGIRAKFFQGKFSVPNDDKEMIERMDQYMRTHPGDEIEKIDEEMEAYVNEAVNKAREEAEKKYGLAKEKAEKEFEKIRTKKLAKAKKEKDAEIKKQAKMLNELKPAAGTVRKATVKIKENQDN